MLRHARARRSAIDVRRCLSCGYAGPDAQLDRELLSTDDETSEPRACPRCACDFRVRPPKSYAEMEGIVDRGAASNRHRAVLPRHEIDIALRTRWVGFLVVTSALLVIAGTLVAMLLSPFTGVGD